MQKLATVTWLQGDGDASLRYAEPALELCEQLGDKRKLLDVHLHFTGLYISGYWDGAKEDKAVEHLEAAAALAEEDPDSVQKGLVYQRTGHLYLHRGQPATTLVWTRRAVDLYTKLNVPMGTALGTALTYTGRIDEGIAYNERAWDSVLKTGNPLIISIFGHELSLTLALVRDLPRAREWGERILLEAQGKGLLEQSLRRPLALIYALSGDTPKADEACEAVERIESRTLMGCNFEEGAGVGFHYLRQGQWEKAGEYLERTILAHQDRNNLAAVAGCFFTLGILKLEQADHARAEELLLRSLEVCRNGGNVLFELWVLPVLVELHLKMRQPAKAEEYVKRGVELMKPDQNWYGLPASLHTAQGMLAVAQKQWDEAAKCFEQAVILNRRYQLPWDEAKTLYEWALMHLARDKAGDREQAQGKIGEALEIFRRVGARKDVEKVLAATATVGGRRP